MEASEHHHSKTHARDFSTYGINSQTAHKIAISKLPEYKQWNVYKRRFAKISQKYSCRVLQYTNAVHTLLSAKYSAEICNIDNQFGKLFAYYLLV